MIGKALIQNWVSHYTNYKNCTLEYDTWTCLYVTLDLTENSSYIKESAHSHACQLVRGLVHYLQVNLQIW